MWTTLSVSDAARLNTVSRRLLIVLVARSVDYPGSQCDLLFSGAALPIRLTRFPATHITAPTSETAVCITLLWLESSVQ